jgi:glutathione peroxidase-family protein
MWWLDVPAYAQEVAVNPLSTLALTRLDGSAMPPGELAGKVVLFVNVASQCGYTPQYEGLQALYQAKKDRGLVIVGVPCNQFGGQEPGGKEEIASFCKLNYGVTFPLLEKQDVNGAGRSGLYRWLVAGGGDVKWNFEKFLVDRTGKIVGRYPSKVGPNDPALLAAIDGAL